MDIIYVIMVINILVLVIGLPYLLKGMYRQSKLRNQEMRRAVYIMEVQKLLFETHTDVSFLEKALEKCAEMLESEKAFIVIIKDGKTAKVYRYPSYADLMPKQFSTEKISESLPLIVRMMREQRSLVINSLDAAAEDLKKEILLLKDPGLKSLMFVPILNNEKKLQAVLGVTNFKTCYDNADLLECVVTHYLLAISNYHSYQKIEEMATIDMLTGLKNRNCYQQDIKTFAEQGHQSLCCIYMDVNGLHEMNNHLGHAAGDDMLRAVGSSIRKHFGEQYSYRLGGDEFLTFCNDVSQEKVQEKMRSFLQDMEQQCYHISVGSYWQDATLQIDVMVSNAEKRMYEEKRRYYEKKGDINKAREMNRKLEETLLQKKDFEYFLTLIAHYFLGVYVVDLNADSTRVIYKPSYFDQILKENDHRYRTSLEKYCQKFVKQEDQQKIKNLLDYDNIIDDLLEQKVVHILYEKTDNTRIRLRVFPAADFCREHRETFWLFEEVSARYKE